MNSIMIIYSRDMTSEQYY